MLAAFASEKRLCSYRLGDTIKLNLFRDLLFRLGEKGDDPEIVKTRLRQWAQVVACSVRQSSPICCDSDCCLGERGSEEERGKSILQF